MQSRFLPLSEQSWKHLEAFIGSITERMKKNWTRNLLYCLTLAMYFKIFGMVNHAENHQKVPSRVTSTWLSARNCLITRLHTSERKESSFNYFIKKRIFCRHHFLKDCSSLKIPTILEKNGYAIYVLAVNMCLNCSRKALCLWAFLPSKKVAYNHYHLGTPFILITVKQKRISRKHAIFREFRWIYNMWRCPFVKTLSMPLRISFWKNSKEPTRLFWPEYLLLH